jgi:hypothetical protein
MVETKGYALKKKKWRKCLWRWVYIVPGVWIVVDERHISFDSLSYPKSHTNQHFHLIFLAKPGSVMLVSVML